MRTFFFHYNKPASQKAGRAQISVHFKGVCHIVDNVIAGVRTEGRVRKTAPRFVMTGKAGSLSIQDGVATLAG